MNGGTPQQAPITIDQSVTSIDVPATPTKAGYTFDGWYADKDFNVKVNIVSTKLDWSGMSIPVSTSLTLYAKWIAANTVYTITYQTNEGSNIAPQSVEKTGTAKATKPTDPTRAGYTFVGWYSDASFATAFDFNTPITSNITLYAKWLDASLPFLNSYNLSSAGVDGLSEDIVGVIDEANLTITLGINIAPTKKANLANITPTLNISNGTLQGSAPSNYSTAGEIGTCTILHPSNGKTKVYKVKVFFASLVVSADVSDLSGIKDYAVEVYQPTPDGQGHSQSIVATYPTTLPYTHADYLEAGKGGFMAIYIRNAVGDTIGDRLVSYTPRSNTTYLQATKQNKFLCKLDFSAMTECLWYDKLGNDRNNTIRANTLAGGIYFEYLQTSLTYIAIVDQLHFLFADRTNIYWYLSRNADDGGGMNVFRVRFPPAIFSSPLVTGNEPVVRQEGRGLTKLAPTISLNNLFNKGTCP